MNSFWNSKTLGIGAIVAFGFLVLGLVLEMAQRVAPVLLLVAVAGVLVGCDGGHKDTKLYTTEAQRKACYADAQAQLSPQWADANRLERAVVAMQVINTCEGQP